MRRKEFTKICAAAGILSLFLCGCQNLDVNYGLDTQDITSSGVSPLELGEVEEWKEEFTVNGDAVSGTVSINSSVTIPDVEQMSVVEFQAVEFDEAYKKKVIEAFFGTSQVYTDEPENWTKARLQEQIDTLEETILSYEEVLQNNESDPDFHGDNQWLKDSIKEYQQEVAKYQEQMKQAPDEFVKIDDYSGDNYVGIFQSKYYTLKFERERGTRVVFCVDDIYDVCPEQVNPLSASEYFVVDSSWMQGKQNLCTTTVAEAKKQAESFLREIGWGEPIWNETEFIMWNDANGEEVIDGYCLTCSLGIDGMALGDFDSGYQTLIEETDEYVGSASIYVNDSGIICLSVSDPVDVVREIQNVQFLSLDTIKGIMRSELSSNPEKYLSNSEMSYFTELELNYIRIKDKSRKGFFTYLPVWRLCNRTGPRQTITSYPVIINAIDGSIIDITDIVQ